MTQNVFNHDELQNSLREIFNNEDIFIRVTENFNNHPIHTSPFGGAAYIHAGNPEITLDLKVRRSSKPGREREWDDIKFRELIEFNQLGVIMNMSQQYNNDTADIVILYSVRIRNLDALGKYVEKLSRELLEKRFTKVLEDTLSKE